VRKKSEVSFQGFPVLAGLAYYFFLRPQMLKWRTKLGESQRRLPGDDRIPQPNLQLTHAINIDAPAEAVWSWLAPMGRERTGYYSLDVMTNSGIPSATFVRQDVPAPAPQMDMEGGYQIMEVEPNRELLFGGFGLSKLPGLTLDLTALYLLERRSDSSTRLLVRYRGFSYGMLNVLYTLFNEVYYFVMLRDQLDHLKQLAESMAHLKTSQP
jgi:hypothetical protein